MGRGPTDGDAERLRRALAEIQKHTSIGGSCRCGSPHACLVNLERYARGELRRFYIRQARRIADGDRVVLELEAEGDA